MSKSHGPGRCPSRPSPSRPDSNTQPEAPAGLPPHPHSAAIARELSTKRRGELAEIAFLHKALAFGFRVSKPYGDSDRYDFITDPCTLLPPGRNIPDHVHTYPSHLYRGQPYRGQPYRGQLYRVQVKCTTQFLNGHYYLNARRRVNGKAVPYTLDEIDFFGALVIPEDSWFLIPLSHILGITSLLLPRRKACAHPYQRYREAWPLLCEPDGLTFG